MAKPGDEFFIDARGIKAHGVVTENGFRVLSGSEVRSQTASYLTKTVVKQREDCIKDGTIVDWKLTKDIDFKSSSTAAYFLLGANSSGPQTWKNKDGITMMKLDKAAEGIIPDVDREYRSFYTVVGGNEGSKCFYPARLDTYGCGCGHDCSYCYAKEILTGHGQWNPQAPNIADVKRIETKVKKLPRGSIVRLGGMTDCFQPIELKYRTTLKTIEILNKYGIGYLIVTKSHIVANDEYIAVMDKNLAHIQITVTTTDDKKSLEYEHASVPSKRIAAIEKLYDAGFDTFFRLSPYMEGFIDFDILNKIRCEKILVEFLRVNSDIKKWFDIDYSDYTLLQEGFYHLPLEKKLEMLSKINGFKEVTVCDDYTDHYEYFQKHFNPNPSDCCNLRKGTI